MARAMDYQGVPHTQPAIRPLPLVEPGPTHVFLVRAGVLRCLRCRLELPSVEAWAALPSFGCRGPAPDPTPGAAECAARGEGL